MARQAGRALAGDHAEAFEPLERRVLLSGSPPSLDDLNDADDIGMFMDGRAFADGAIMEQPDGTLEQDLFKFTAPAADFVRVLADAQNIDSSDLDTRVELFEEVDGEVQAIGSSSDGGNLTAGTPTDAWFGFVAEENAEYFVRVSSEPEDPDADEPADEPGATGQYTLRVRTGSEELVYDSNTDAIGLPPIDPMNGPMPIEGVLGDDDPSTAATNDEFTQDDAFFRFTTPSDEAFDSLMGAGARALNGAIELDTRLDIYDAQGNPVAADSQSSFETAAFTTLRSSPDTEFFFRIRSDEFEDPDNRPSTGEFGLKVIGSANEVPIDPVRREGSSMGALLFSEDFDLRRFEAQTSGQAFVTAQAISAPFDVRVTLFDSEGEQIAFEDDTFGLNAEVQPELTGGDDYFVLIDSPDDAQVTPPLIGGDQFSLTIEAAHPFDDPPTPLDDHPDTPEEDSSEAQRRERFQDATPLVFEDPTVTLDGLGNVVRDRGLTTTANSTGRIFESGDSDLFQFVPPADMLSDYQGNNDDEGTSLFTGGAFTGAEQNSPFPVDSDALALWDAADWWAIGDQRVEPNTETQLGFVDNPATPSTDGPVVHSMLGITPDDVNGTIGAPMLVVGGDFNLNVPVPPPNPPFVETFTNLAVWSFDAALGRYAWSSLGDVNGPVHAIETWDPEAPEDGMDPGGPQIAIGGQFTQAGGEGAQNLATFDLTAGAWQNLPAPAIGGASDTVRALEVYDPRDPGSGREADMDAGLDMVADPPDEPPSLIIGGEFSDPTGVGTNLSLWNGTNDARPLSVGVYRDMNGAPLPSGDGPEGTDGPVHALTVFNPPEDEDDDETDFDPRLIIGGQFSQAGDASVNNIASFGMIGGEQDDEAPNYAPHLEYQALGSGVRGGASAGVFALETWTPPEIEGFDVQDVLGLTPNVPDDNEALVIGGAFTQAGAGGASNIALWDGAPGGGVYAPLQNLDNEDTGEGFTAPVRSLEAMSDAQEPLVDEMAQVDDPGSREVIYAGGDFARGVAMFDIEDLDQMQLNDQNPGVIVPAFLFAEPQGQNGLDVQSAGGSVYALAEFDDQNPDFDNSDMFFDRHDRPAARPQLTVGPASGSFINAEVRVFNSNLEVIYSPEDDPGADTIAPPMPDPAGMIDPAAVGRDVDFEEDFTGVDLWAGEVYYIEVVSSTNTGPFNLSLSVSGLHQTDLDADGVITDVNGDVVTDNDDNPITPDADGDGQFPDLIGPRFEVQNPEVFENAFAGAPNRTLTSAGDATTEFGLDQGGLQGNQIRVRRQYDTTLAGAPATFPLRVPSQDQTIGEEGDLGLIHSVNDKDVYQFTAPKTGTVELRVATTGLADNFRDTDGTVKSSTYDSPLDAAIRLFNNDFEQIGYNDESNIIPGARETHPFTGTFPFASQLDSLTYNERDPRLVVPVEEGVTYFAVIESGQRYVDGSLETPDDRERAERPEIDWRHATGSYDLLINAPNAESALDTGDDHIDDTLGQGTVIPIREDGTSELNLFTDDNGTPDNEADDFFYDGRINDSDDTDRFELIAPVTGTMTVRVERVGPGPQDLQPAFTVNEVVNAPPNAQINELAATTAQPGGFAETTVQVDRGDLLDLEVNATFGTGQYRVSISGLEFTEDHADEIQIPEATEIELLDFLGSGAVSGSIERPGDSDLFKFTPTEGPDAQDITVTLESANNMLNSRVTVFEVTEDTGAEGANPVFAEIGRSEVGPNGGPGSETTVAVNADRVSGATEEAYPEYYVLVEGTSPENDAGDYTLRLSFTPTDDHPDLADLETRPGNASTVLIDQSTGVGELGGDIEIASDSDLFTFIGAAGGPATISAIAADPPPNGLNSEITVFDAGGDEIASGTSNVELSGADRLVRNQRYFVVVAPNDSAPPATRTGGYTLRIQGPANDDHPNEGEFGLATEIMLDPETGDGAVGTGSAGPGNPRISPSNDTDLFTFTTLGDASADEPLSITFSALPLGSSGPTVEPRVTVFDAQQTQVAQDSSDTPGDMLTIDIDPALAPAGTTFFVLVEDQSEFGAPQNNNQYTLAVDGPPGSPPPGDDPDSIDFTDPRVLSLNSLGDRDAEDEIEVSDDRDLFRFTPTSDGTAFVQVVTPSGSVLDASVTILDAPAEDPGNVVASDSGGIAGVSASTSFEAVAGTDYYAIVDGVGPATGSYTIRVDASGGEVVTQIPEVDQLGFNNRLFFPEGFASAQTSEFVSIANPNDFDVRYSMILRYEEGQRDAVVVNDQLIEAGSRGGETLSRVGDFADGVRSNTPYAIEVVSSGPLGATLSRFDFNTSQGEAFTTRMSSDWTFGRVQREPGVRDFVVLFNPADFAVDVTLSATLPDGTAVETTKRVEGLRRSGFAIEELSSFPQGVFGAELSAEPVNSSNDPAFDGIVASISHFDVSAQKGYALLGDSVGGNTAGSINNLTQGGESDAEVVLFNPTDQSANVSLEGKYVRADLPDVNRNLTISANQSVVLDGADLGLVADQPIGLIYESNVPVSVVFSEDRPSDSNGQAASSLVGTNFFFGDAYIGRPRAGEIYFETLSFFNPSSSDIDIEVELLYVNGNSETFDFNVGAEDFDEFVIHESDQFLEPTTPDGQDKTSAFSIQVTSASPFSVSLNHFDLFFGSGWGTGGANLGLINPVSRIL